MYRSFLYVPVTSSRFVEKAADRGADAIILDLEDSVAPSEKERARGNLEAAARQCARGGAAIWVRINRPFHLAVPDLQQAVRAQATGIISPKTRSAEHIRMLAEVATSTEREIGRTSPIRIIASIETPDALLQARDIADADPRVLGLSGAGEDFATAMRSEPSRETAMIPKMLIHIAARAAGRHSFGMFGTVSNYTDVDGIRERALEARRYGFDGATCIHPSVIPILNECFSPTEQELDDARELIAEFEASLARGDGAFSHKGKMVDIPIVERARNLLASSRRPA